MIRLLCISNVSLRAFNTFIFIRSKYAKNVQWPNVLIAIKSQSVCIFTTQNSSLSLLFCWCISLSRLFVSRVLLQQCKPFYFILIRSYNSLVIAKWWLYYPIMTDPVAERLWDNFISIELMQNNVVHWLHQADYWCCDYITVICCRSVMSTQPMETSLCLDYK